MKPHLDDTILWEMFLPGVGTGHAFQIKNTTDIVKSTRYFVSGSGQLYRETDGVFQEVNNFSGEIMFYDKNTALFTAEFKNGMTLRVSFK
jgi:hypothetical protein